MAHRSVQPVIRLRGVRHNNLQGFDLELPQNRLIVVTGLSGSGKSSLAFDTLFAEGQRRYIETFTPYARQFFDRMDKPRVDSVEGIPPAIAIEQRNAVRTTRSTVGTMTEICDYLKVLWPHLAHLHCRECGRPVRQDSPQAVWQDLQRKPGGFAGTECLVTFDLALTEKMSLEDSLRLIAAQGYQRLLVGGEVRRLEDLGAAGVAPGTLHAEPQGPTPRLSAVLTVVQDRLRIVPANRARFVEACEQAYHFGKSRLSVWRADTSRKAPAETTERRSAAGATDRGMGASPTVRGDLPGSGVAHFSNRRHCSTCDLEYQDPAPALFSFNHPVGACPRCKGFGRIIEIDYRRAIPDRGRTLADGAVKPWQSGMSAECQEDLRKFCWARQVPMNVPFRALSEAHQRWVLEGDPDYGVDEEHQWPRAWYGVKGYFRWLESRAYKMHVRVLLSRYRAYITCPECHGKRLKPEALLYRLVVPQPERRSTDEPQLEAPGSAPRDVASDATPVGPGRAEMSLADLYALPVRHAWRVVDALWRARSTARSSASQAARPKGGRATGPDPVSFALDEVRSRLGYLVEVGLGYLALDRATRTLSGGETERVNLTTCLGSRLVNTLFVLDEPSVGLHPRDTDRLIRILERLRNAENTVVVVEHEASVMRAADQIVDLGPGHGETGGRVVFQGPYADLLRSGGSLTGAYLSGRRHIAVPTRRVVLAARHAALSLSGVTRHNLRDLSVEVPLQRFVVVTGVSGSGKSTLVREVLYPALEARLRAGAGGGEPPPPEVGAAEDADGSAGEATGDELPAGRLSSDHETVLAGYEALNRVVMVDQSSLGRTPRSNPAVYIGAFDHLRDLFAAGESARERGLHASAFSFNSAEGQCERCRGAGFEKIEMQFLSDVFIRCPDCAGRRYRAHVLECKLQNAEAEATRGKGNGERTKFEVSSNFEVRGAKGDDRRAKAARRSPKPGAGWSIADVLEASADAVVRWLEAFGEQRHARRAAEKLRLLQAVGLGYLRLGQPINTLSGGESQRLKLAAHLAEAGAAVPGSVEASRTSNPEAPNQKSEIRNQKSETPEPGSTLFLFDEPTTGLHFEDVRVLVGVFQRLVDGGHSVVVIEHNLEVIKCADWVLDLGPEAGDEGGQVVVAGTPEQVAACEQSHTGRALRTVLSSRSSRVTVQDSPTAWPPNRPMKKRCSYKEGPSASRSFKSRGT